MIYAIISVTLLLILFCLIWDYYGPKKVMLTENKVFGMNCIKGRGLIVHEYDHQGNLYASRGLSIYKLAKGEIEFVKVAHIEVGLSLYWLNNFTFIRKFLNKPECVELIVNKDEKFCAFSAGFMFFWDDKKRKFIKTFKLPNFGIGIGRGIMSTGIVNTNNNRIYIGEYFRNELRKSVSIFQSLDFGKTWSLGYNFQEGKIRHIHAIQQDPYTGNLWVCTGDEDHESMIAYSNDFFKTIRCIGQGSQMWRTCQLIFTEQSIYWGTDTGDEEVSGIYKWDRDIGKVHKLQHVPGAIFYGTKLTNGNLLMSTDRENFPNEKDDKTRLYIISKEDNVTEIECGIWKNKNVNIKFSFAKSRIQRNQGGEFLAVNFINQKEVDGEELILITESEINRLSKFSSN